MDSNESFILSQLAISTNLGLQKKMDHYLKCCEKTTVYDIALAIYNKDTSNSTAEKLLEWAKK